MEATTASLADLNAQMAELGYRYVYDHRNRLVEKQIPGKDKEYIVYNDLDQPILTQDANLRANGQWLFTKYDAFGRVAYTGMANAGDLTSVKTAIANSTAPLWVTQTGTPTNFGGVTDGVYYSADTYPSTNIEILTINYYDTYVGQPTGAPNSIAILGSSPAQDRAQNVKGLPTVSKVKVLDPSASPGQATWITSLTYYDHKARAVYAYTENAYHSTVDIVETQLDFVGKPLKTRTEHRRNATTVVTIDNYTYDHVGRLLSQTQCVGDEAMGHSCEGTGGGSIAANLNLTGTITGLNVAGQSITFTEGTLTDGAHLRIDPNAGTGGQEELIAYNDYDELGQLRAKKVGGAMGTSYATTAGLQTVDYTYNVRGWLKTINNDQFTDDNDLFDFGINYNTVAHGATALFNGNISETIWKTANDDPSQKWYAYSYDALNRITGAMDDSGRYTVNNIAYDKMGNINSLNRQGHTATDPNTGFVTEYGTMDQLSYAYAPNSNKLMAVTDAITGTQGNGGFIDGNKTGNDYAYDANGNMVSDLNKGISSIEYNHLNLPTAVGMGNGIISYIYDATGTKMRKTVSTGTTTDYAGNYIYENNQLQFFSTPEGYVEPNTTGGYDYIYQYKDHLGNIRLSYKNVGTATVDLEIQEENNYYPFGLKHRGYNGMQSAARDHKFEYNGVELEESLGMNLMEMSLRHYDPAIGRWTGIDPLTHHSVSPYQAFDNNPIYWADPSGANSVRDLINDAFNNTPNDGLVHIFDNQGNEIGTSTTEEYTSRNNKNESNEESGKSEEASPFPWPFPGAYFGELRHLTGPDAIAVSLDIDLVVPNGGVVVTPIGALLVLKGPQAGSIEYIYDIGVAAGLDISASGKLSEFYFNGKTNDITVDTFLGGRIGADIAATIFGIDLGKGFSYAPGGDTFIQNAVFSLSTSLGIGIPAPIAITGNVNAGYTGSWDKIIKSISDSQTSVNENK